MIPLLRPRQIVPVSFLALLLGGGGCATIAPYSETAYRYATTLKVESLTLMDKAIELFAQHEAAVQALMIEVEKAYEYARGRPKNAISTRQWEVLKSPDRALLGGFMNRWRESGKLAKPFIDQVKGNVADAFDTISDLESGKIKPSDVKGNGPH